MTKMRPFMGDRVQATIAAIYDAAMDTERLPEVLDGIASLLGAKGLLMGPLSPKPTADPSLVSYASEVFHEAVPDYIENWIAINPRRNWLLKHDFAERIFVDHDIMDEESMRRNAFYHDFLRRNGNLWCLDRVTSQLGGDRRLWISVQYGDQAAPPNTADRDLFELLSSHLLQALSMYRQMNRLTVNEAALLDRYDCAAFILSGNGRILRMNAEAEALDGPDLRIAHGRLVAAGQRDEERLQRLIGEALRAGLGETTAPMTVLEGKGGDRPILLRAAPLRRERVDQLLAGLITDVPRLLLLGWRRSPQRARTTEDALRLFGLTPTEARVADLVGGGLSPDEAAVALGIAVSTARLHLKRSHDKLGIRRQAELVRLVSRLSSFG